MKIPRKNSADIDADMTPLIDVVFQLLVFFMVSSVFLSPAMKMNLPKASYADEDTPREVKLFLLPDGTYKVNSAPVPEENLVLTLNAELAQMDVKSITIHADGEIPYRRFVLAMDKSRQAGASKVNLVHDGDK